MKGINVKKSFGWVAAGASLMLAGAATAQSISPPGPLQISGEVSVDNTAKSGGVYSDFACSVEMFGLATGTNSFVITGVQILNDGDGQIPRGCNAVVPAQLPWTATITGASAPYTLTIDDVAFQAQGQPGCGYSGGSPDPASQLVTTWAQDDTTVPAGAFFDAAYSRVELSSDTISDGDTGDCTISGELKVTRPMAPIYSP